MRNKFIALVFVAFGCINQQETTSEQIDDLRAQCWEGPGWSQCCIEYDDGSGTCCRTLGDDTHCWDF